VDCVWDYRKFTPFLKCLQDCSSIGTLKLIHQNQSFKKHEDACEFVLQNISKSTRVVRWTE
jgi:hypothetical protein